MATRTHAAFLTQARNVNTISPLLPKIEQFNKDVEQYLPADGHRVAFASAWLATDNVFVALMHEHHPKALQGLSLVAIDTMHLFPETLKCAEEMQAKYGKQALLYTPKGITTRDEFEAIHGHCEEMSHADFDFVSKVEPFSRALKEVNKDILITGRRMDQGNERIELPIWEEDKRIMNPLANWSWSDITSFVDYKKVPYNKRHHMVFRAVQEIPATERHLDNLPWT
jgi:phosphoadenosine phosphosulfate reductase